MKKILLIDGGPRRNMNAAARAAGRRMAEKALA